MIDKKVPLFPSLMLPEEAGVRIVVDSDA